MRIPPRNKKIKSYWFGIIAEYIAILFLLMKGYKILKRRYKTFAGEVDIIARKSKAIISVEVKARRKKMVENGFLIDEALGENQKKRIKRATMNFMARNFKKYHDHSTRFDLIIISPYRMPLHLVGFWE